MAHPEDPKSNRLLAALSDAGWQRWRLHLERVDMKLGQVLYEPSRPPVYAYFPTSAIVSLQYVMGSGASSEIAVVGNEGIVGTSLFLGGGATTSHGSVLIAGQGFRIGAQMIRDEFDRSDSVRLLLLRYTQALLTQIAQTAACNRRHTVDQQVCGWLLHSLDRLRGSEVVVTQELMASVLGVRRESVTDAAGRLQAAGLIRCARGHISVLDRAGLERRSCECHAVVKKEYDRLLPQESAATCEA
jgi:CRP-like cAMP-binding protein